LYAALAGSEAASSETVLDSNAVTKELLEEQSIHLLTREYIDLIGTHCHSFLATILTRRHFTVSGLPLGPLNTLKSLFKHLVPNVPKSQKVVPEVPISV